MQQYYPSFYTFMKVHSFSIDLNALYPHYLYILLKGNGSGLHDQMVY